MKRLGVALGLLVVVTLAFPSDVVAQNTTGTISGVVRDPNGGPVPGVTIVTNSPALIQADLLTVSNERGQYRLNLLPPGVYEVSFRLQGFQTLQRAGVRRQRRPEHQPRRKPRFRGGRGDDGGDR